MHHRHLAQTALLLLAIGSPAVAQATLIGVAPAGTNATNLLRVETGTFSTTTISTVAAQALSGLAVQPHTGSVFASAGSGGQGQLWSIDTAAGTATLVGSPGFLFVPALAFDTDGTLFATTRTQGTAGTDTLITLDLATAQATVVGLFGAGIESIDAIAVDPTSGTLYGASAFQDNAGLYTIDKNTGAATRVGSLSDANGRSPMRIAGLTIDCAGRGYGSYGGGMTGGGVIAIDIANLKFSFVGQAANGSVSDIVAVRCPTVGPNCSSGGTICSATLPRIGTNWETCSIEPSCGTANHVMLLGPCLPGPVLPSPPACASCSTCPLNVGPVIQLPWTAPCLTVGIPNDPTLVGGLFCIQDVCVQTAMNCFCLTNTLQVTVLP